MKLLLLLVAALTSTAQQVTTMPATPVPTAKQAPTCIPVGSPNSPVKGTHVPKKLGGIWEKARKKISDQTGVDLGSAEDIKKSVTPPPCPVVPATPAAQATPATAK